MKKIIPIRVLIADDHELIRRGLHDLLEATAGFEVVGEATTVAETVAMADDLLPDVIILDAKMPRDAKHSGGEYQFGFEAAQQIALQHKQIKIVMLTSSAEIETFREAQQHRLSGFITKSEPGSELLKTIRSVYHGNIYLKSPTIPDRFSETPAEPKRIDSLTRQQKRVLFLLKHDMTTAQIAESLKISKGTVALHIRAILKILRVHKRMEAIRIAEKENLSERE